MGTYYIFLSCDKISVENIHIQEYLNERIPKTKNIFIRCIPKHNDIESFKCEIDELSGSGVYVVGLTRLN